jgi:glycogen(starch) synthase
MAHSKGQNPRHLLRHPSYTNRLLPQPSISKAYCVEKPKAFSSVSQDRHSKHHEYHLNILIYSRVFRPSIGGQEIMMEILAEEFVAAGHEVRVVTLTATEEEGNCGYEVVRLPSLRAYVQLLRWSDVCLYASVSLRGLWPIVVGRKPFVISHQTVYDSPALFDAAVALKKAVTRFSNNISCSRSVQSRIGGQSVVIPNTYRSEIFKEFPEVARDLDIVCVGRLVPDKGIEDAVDALSQLRQEGLRPQLSVVGDGPGSPVIAKRVGELGLGQQVSFVGIKRGLDLAKFIARHRVMAVPSRWAEPFGIVALEGIACGCVVVGTDRGGLPEAIGPSGITVPSADSAAMARALKSLLEDDSLLVRYRSCAPAHLARHSREVVARCYLKVLAAAASAPVSSAHTGVKCS